MNVQLFDGNGRFVMPSDDALADLEPARRETVFGIRDASDSLNAAELELQNALTERAHALKANTDAQKNVERPTAVDAARAWIDQQHRNANGQ